MFVEFNMKVLLLKNKYIKLNIMIELFKSYWFNILIAVLTAFFGIMQEVWDGNSGVGFWNLFGLGACAGICMSAAAEGFKCLMIDFNFNWKNVLYGGVAAVVFALLLLFII